MKVPQKHKPGSCTQSSYKTTGYTHQKPESGNIKVLYTMWHSSNYKRVHYKDYSVKKMQAIQTVSCYSALQKKKVINKRMDETEDDYMMRNKPVLQRKKLHFLAFVDLRKGKGIQKQ